MGLLKPDKTLSELEEDEEYLKQRVAVARQRAMLKELEQREGKGAWKRLGLSDDGKRPSVGRIWQWLKSH